MRHSQLPHLLVSMLALLTGCSAATITNTWKSPDVSGPIQFHKVVTLAIGANETVRNVAEEAMAEQITKAQGVPGYTLLTDDDRNDIEKLKAKLKANAVDGAVTMKLLDKRQESTYVAGSPSYGSFYNYYGGTMMSSPGYVVTDTIASVEIKIYSVNDGKLLWSATSDVFNPSDIRSNVRDIAKAVGEKLRKDGLMQKEST